MLGDEVYLARVAPSEEEISDGSKWEFYAGGHGADAKWAIGDVAQARAPLTRNTVYEWHPSRDFATWHRRCRW